jgi:hypothetical protein
MLVSRTRFSLGRENRKHNQQKSLCADETVKANCTHHTYRPTGKNDTSYCGVYNSNKRGRKFYGKALPSKRRRILSDSRNAVKRKNKRETTDDGQKQSPASFIHLLWSLTPSSFPDVEFLQDVACAAELVRHEEHVANVNGDCPPFVFVVEEIVAESFVVAVEHDSDLFAAPV